MITVNSVTRQFNVPGSDLVFGVSGDSDVERKHFQCPRYVGDGLDLAACFIRMNYRNANGSMDFYLVDDLAIDGDNITFSWLLSPRVTEYKGQVKFVMCAVGPDLKLKWHTTQGTGQVMDGLEPDNSHVESQTADVVAQLIAMVDAQTVAVEKVGAEQVANVNATAETATMAAVNEIEAKRANSLASIPNDYTSLSSAVESLTRGKALAIVCDAEGTAITVDDASDMPIQGLRIFGRSTQNGTPTPSAPVEIVSVESPVVRVCGKNLFDISRIVDATNVVNNGDGSLSVTSSNSSFSASTTKTLRELAPGIVAGQTYTLTAKADMLSNARKKMYLSHNDGTRSWLFGLPMDVDETGLESRVYFYSNDNENQTRLYDIQIEAGAVATAYEPYKPIQTIETAHPLRGIPVIDGGNYTDANGQQWICDEVDLERGVYVQRIATNVLPRNLGWIRGADDQQTNNTTLFYTNKEDRAPGESNFICDKLPVRTVLTTANDRIGIWGLRDRWILYVRISGVYTLGEFGDWLDRNQLKLTYVLGTPIETPLSETELATYRNLHSNYPNTTVLNDAGAHMVVKYAADTKLYIDNKIKEALK